MIKALVLVALVLFNGQEVSAREAAGAREATPAEIAAFLHDLQAFDADLARAETKVFSNKERMKECRYQSLNRPIWTAREEHLTAVCAVRHFWPGRLSEFLAIGQCESGWSRFSYNDNPPGQEDYEGLFQHAASSYTSRIATYDPPAWHHPLSPKWTNSRGQIVMSARMMAASGTGAWTCA